MILSFTDDFFSFVAQFLIQHGAMNNSGLTCICLCIVVGILMEFILGTFDVVDILVQWVAIGIAASQYEKVRIRGGRENGKY